MIDLIPKQAFSYPKSTSLFFYGSIALLLLVAGAYGGIRFLQARTLGEIQEIENQLSREKTPAEVLLEKRVLSYERKLNDFSSLAGARSETLPFFLFLEENTYPALVFKHVSLNVREKTLSLVGEALDFKTLEQQLSIFKAHEKVASAEVSDISIGEKGRAAFKLKLIFNEKLFQ